MPRITAEQAGGQNMRAILDAIALGEIGEYMLAHTDDGYNVLVGSVPPSNILTFDNYASHPNVYNPKLNSTAAGRYQILNRYAIAYMKQLSLPDFSPISQDAIAIQMIKERGAYQQALRGDVIGALTKLNTLWASLPGSPYRQRTDKSPSMSAFVKAFVVAGGEIA